MTAKFELTFIKNKVVNSTTLLLLLLLFLYNILYYNLSIYYDTIIQYYVYKLTISNTLTIPEYFAVLNQCKTGSKLLPS